MSRPGFVECDLFVKGECRECGQPARHQFSDVDRPQSFDLCCACATLAVQGSVAHRCGEAVTWDKLKANEASHG